MKLTIYLHGVIAFFRIEEKFSADHSFEIVRSGQFFITRVFEASEH
jgi:hypothetical protein